MTTLGRYEIMERLGTGSMGTVYRAHDTVLDREVALKTIRTDTEVDPELRERFYREARACARLQHHSIISVYDLGEIDRVAYIAMELLRGSDFRKVIEQRLEIPVATKIEVMAQVCEALAHAHSHGVIHRDIKPSNLFLTEKRHAKVLDFGIARLPSSRLTVAGKILGTPNYMAPEQILAKPSDPRSDIFSAAVVFFEFLVYAHPFQSPVIPRRIVEGPPDSPFDYNSSLPVPLESVFARALAKNPDERYQSADEFAVDLRALQDAVRQNSSPTFSRFQLPSVRDLPGSANLPPPLADPTLLTPPPPGEDPYEWRLSEVMRLIPEFESAVERFDATAARGFLAQLEAIQAVDSRFTKAVQLCRDKLAGIPAFSRIAAGAQASPSAAAAETESRTATAKVAAPVSDNEARRDPLTSPAIRPASSAPIPEIEPNKNGSHKPIDIDATIVLPREPMRAEPVPSRQAEPEPVQSREEASEPYPPSFPAVTSPPWRTMTPGPPVATIQWKHPKEWPKRTQQIAVAGVGVLLCVLLITILVAVLWPVPVDNAAGTAEVAADHTPVYKDKEPGSRVGFLARGTRVNVLKLPDSREQEWVRVQVTSPKPRKPGYMRVRDLVQWESTKPSSKLSLIEIFHPGDTGSDNEIEAKLDELEQFIVRFPKSKEASTAHLRAARLGIDLVRRAQAAGQAMSIADSRPETVRRHLDAIASDPSFAGQVQAAREALEKATSAGPTPADAVSNTSQQQPPESPPSASRVRSWVAQTRQALTVGDYGKAESLIEKIKKWQPDDEDLQRLEHDLRRQREIFR
jgi:serine/threonine protein kinase